MKDVKNMKEKINLLMNPENYLRQAYRLDLKINSDIEEAQRLRAMADSISSPSWGEKVQSTRSGEPTFVRCILKITELEEKINQEIDTLRQRKACFGLLTDVRYSPAKSELHQ